MTVVVLDGVSYEIVLPPEGERLCGLGQSFHQHEHPHDTVPAGASHHHHTEACLQIRAVLRPVSDLVPLLLPDEVVVRQGKEWWAVPVPEPEAEAHAVG